MRNLWTPNKTAFRTGVGKVTIKNNNRKLVFTVGDYMKFSVKREYHAEKRDHFNFHLLQLNSKQKFTSGIVGTLHHCILIHSAIEYNREIFF